MNFQQWQEFNNTDLARRLIWLRGRFQALFDKAESTEEPDAFEQVGGEALNDETLPAMELLAVRLGLTKFECEVLLLCAAMEFDPGTAARCAMACENPSQPFPTFALAMTLFDDPDWNALTADRPLRHARLIEINQPGSTPLTAAALRADERIVNFLKGLNSLDDRIVPLLMPFDANADVPLPPSHEDLMEDITRQLDQASQADESGRLPLIQLAGADATSKQLLAQHAAARIGAKLLRLPVELIPNDFTELETLLRLWDRESRLLPIALYVDAHDSDGAAFDKPASSVCRFLARASGLLFLDTHDLRPTLGRESLLIDVSKPTATEQRDLWQSLLSDAATAIQLAGQFSLNAATIHRIASGVGFQPAVASPIHEANGTRQAGSLPHQIWNACRRSTRPRLESLAQRIDAKATWEDLVLPADESTQLREIAAQIQHRSQVYDNWGFRAKNNRGLGVSVLFAGESGTGKTMAAEVIANALRLDLYRIDLSAVVNKYIGETEKNLRRLFDAADDSGAILFFDEADSLFGKRTEVKDSHDRYANLEVNYLLQRMESYRGLAILATNLKSSLDQAFLRRLRFVVNFPVPDATQRRELWRKAFPTEMPLASLDLDRLSRLNITGGNIHTIALNAAFASANDSPQLSMPHILKAARSEYRKLQKPINAADFRTPELEGSVR